MWTDEASTRRRAPTQRVLRGVLEWYFENVYAKLEGPGVVPFYCAPEQVGAFAVRRDDLAAGRDGTLFRLFVALSMFQALRDVVIMAQQRALPLAAVRSLTTVATLHRAIKNNGCPKLASAAEFDGGCSVAKGGGRVDCSFRPGRVCHVKEATVTFNRMGDMGKLPTSAWLNLLSGGSFRSLLHAVVVEEQAPAKRAAKLVERFSYVHRVGRKLATMFVSALSTPALAPGLTPWFPSVDGNDLVVVDTNVARAVDTLRPADAPRTYGSRERWLREQGAHVDLRQFHPDVPSDSPRLVQQAIYAFCSKSNRVAHGDPCAARSTPCAGCTPALCPFGAPRDRAA